MTNGTLVLPPRSSATNTLVGGARPVETGPHPSTQNTLVLGSAEAMANMDPTEPPPPRSNAVVQAAPPVERSYTAVLARPPMPSAGEAASRTAETVQVPKPPVAKAIVPAQPARWLSPKAALALGAGVFALGLAALFALKYAVTRSDRWLTPMRLSATDPRVLQTAATIEEARSKRAELVLSRQELDAGIAEANRTVEIESVFQRSYQAAIASDLRNQRAELKRLSTLLEREEGNDNDARHEETAGRVSLTRRRVALLEAFAKSSGGKYDDLALRREYDRSVSAGKLAFERAVTLATSRLRLDERIAKTDQLLETLAQSAYANESDGDVVLGFVPYGNVAQLREGTPLVACAATFLRCRTVGKVGKLLTPEVQGTHAFDGTPVRGQLVRLTITERGAAALPYLYAGKPPFRS